MNDRVVKLTKANRESTNPTTPVSITDDFATNGFNWAVSRGYNMTRLQNGDALLNGNVVNHRILSNVGHNVKMVYRPHYCSEVLNQFR